ncbi:FtsB family cell division protein [Gaoshiqia sediminis]|uniref:Septum formation initiator family protein n=1 Tax=Gaoshiqia sediminis TaxID=2986998 RepID=A0AA41Y8D0_9BACT|nr:septum formation initiator family protein [Gaoshiqia sediminis]MCW0481148.1 septum formation initiator family protein [Gaoshiqia sediminis]
MKSALFSILRHPKAKFGILLLVFALWIGFFAEHNLVRHFQDKYKLKKLLDQKEYLQEKIHSDQRKIQELQTNQKNLEKFAREQFLMKKENEDVFVIVEE